jgi:DNA-binding MarR family transcriptional regulator
VVAAAICCDLVVQWEIVRVRSTSVKAHPVDDVAAAGTNVLFDVWLLSRATTGLLDVALAPTGLTADEFGLYSVLTSAETMTPSQLARWMSAPPTTVSSYIKRLESRGHLARERNPDDGRSSVLRLTAAGRSAHAAAAAAFAPVLGEVSDRLGNREASVRRALKLLRDRVDDVAAGHTGRS